MVDNHYKSQDVFTPTMPAKASFVERDALNTQLVDALETPGKQIVVYGQSGTGKTTLLINKLYPFYANRKITSRCTIATTFEGLLLGAFDQLDVFYASGASIKKATDITGKIEQSYLTLKAAIEAKSSTEEQATLSRLIPPQLTPQRLAEFCGAAGCCWVLEDFHKVPTSEKAKLSQVMKVFTDTAADFPSVKVIAIGAVGTAREVIQYDPEMRNRVAEIAVPMMTVDELKAILLKGEELLKIKFGEHKDQIAKYSSGMGAVCHQLALNICNTANIRGTCEKETWITNGQFKDAIKRYVDDSSDTLKTVFDIALKQERSRTFDNTRIILGALTLLGDKGGTHAQILKKIREGSPQYPTGNLTTYLGELQTAKRGQIIRCDTASGEFFFSDPLYLAYAQCMFVPPKEAKVGEMKLFGMTFKFDTTLFEELKIELEKSSRKGSISKSKPE